MAKLKPKHAISKNVFSGFHGICSPPGLDCQSAVEIRNFRIGMGGSLKKRSGWRRFQQLPEAIRGYWEGSLDENDENLIVCGNRILRFTGTASAEQIGSLSSTEGKVTFLKYGDTLCLLDGSDMRIYRSVTKRFEAVEAYAPLYGYGWNPSTMGQVNEPLNLLTPRLRIHYNNSVGSTQFSLPFLAKSIDSVRVNNASVSNYSLNSVRDLLTIPTASSAQSVEIAFTMDFENDLTTSLLQSSVGFVDRNKSQETLLLSGSARGYRVFTSTPVTTSMLNYCKVAYPVTDALYFKEANLLNLGDSDNPIRAFCKHYDRVLAFNEQGAWALTQEKNTDHYESYPTLLGMGCNAAGAVCIYENDLLLLNRSGLHRIASNASTPDTYRFEMLSLPIPEIFTKSLLENAFLYLEPWHDELWLRDPADTEGLVLIWGFGVKEWYLFDHVHASQIFRGHDTTCFINGYFLHTFEDTLTSDAGSPYTAVYQSDYFSFGSPETLKRALRTVLCTSTKENTVHLKLETDQDHAEFSFVGKKTDAPEVFDRRVNLDRFRLLRFRISVAGLANTCLYTLSFYTKP